MVEDIGDQTINLWMKLKKMSKEYEYIIIGAGIAGCSTAYFLSKYSDSVLLIDKNSDIAQGASGAAGAFLSPLLGKPNKFKDLVTKALNFSTKFYLENIPSEITNCGTLRIPKNQEDKDKFESYKPYMDFPYEIQEEGCFFEIGSQVNVYNVCSFLSKNIEKLFDFDVYLIKKEENYWFINKKLKAKNLILTTGADIELIQEEYFNIRAVWGQKIDILTSTKVEKNYHKACSVSSSKTLKDQKKYLVSIGATHHRFECDKQDDCNICIKGANINKTTSHNYTIDISNNDTKELLEKANDILILDEVEVVDVKVGARASSIDYFPMVGKLIDSKASIEKYPHLKNGSHIKNEMLKTIDNLYVLNGVGGRGFVLSPYLANQLVELIVNKKNLEEDISTHRLFKRWVKKSDSL